MTAEPDIPDDASTVPPPARRLRQPAGGIDVDRLWEVAEEKLRWAGPAPPDDLHIAGLRRLAQGLERSAMGEARALRTAKREILAWIGTYLAFARDLDRHPEIREVSVQKPLFIVAFGRTGSSFLHQLLALDPAARAPQLWELWSPSPPPACRDHGRIEMARQRLALLEKAVPALLQAHPMAAEAPDECHWMMRHSSISVMLYGVPEYWAWLKGLRRDELRELYAHYKLQVQHLSLHQRRRHWLSKAFSHLHYLPVLFDVFPDARVVRLHRHPSQAIPSLCNLALSYRSMFSDRVDTAALGAAMLDLFEDGMQRSIECDAGPASGMVTDVSFAELIGEPVGTLRRIYDTLGYPWSATFERRVGDHLQGIARQPPYRHRYNLQQFGLSASQVLERTTDYLAWAETRIGSALTA